MNLEYLTEQKEKFLQKVEYFKDIGFDVLTADFQCVVDLINKMEDYIKEKENGEEV